MRVALLRDGAIVADDWLPPAEQSPNDGEARILTLTQWQGAACPGDAAVQLEAGDDLEPLLAALAGLPLVAVHFASFTDGRGFSLARRLREAGFIGELRARGQLLPDQAQYLQRCGFNALEFTDPERLAQAQERLSVFSNGYQGAADQPLPLFRRRA
ncbi:Oxidoreductase probably involved in sulfite reduction [Pseudohaliea rubra DSM 19751]|uniref:Oxidoreductase probably involved in sulfite reduction n=1 Tax=Pseudohaliea rubra DSM 19751 TaxID=1265313 RepID=A0A095VQC3_9GAMM|nr:Oxidoreductase probably involved in sulfite reduction [Pseudohaliea rubra DSM 19751]